MSVKNSRPVPWITHPAMRYLESLLTKETKILEFGSGFSTLYFSNNVARIVSFESSIDWYDKLQSYFLTSIECRAKVSLISVDASLSGGALLESFSEKLSEHQEVLSNFDIFFIDGGNRNVALEFVLLGCSSNSIIILDNSDDLAYISGIKLLVDAGWHQIPFFGFGPINPYPWETSFFIQSIPSSPTRS